MAKYALDKPQERILKTATKLFLRDGYHATGIDTIVAEAGVAKMSLYKHFKSKEDLILEVLKQRDKDWRQRFQTTVERLGKTPRQQVLAVFDALEDWFSDDDFYGCAFINAAAEFSTKVGDNPVLSIAVQHTELVADYVRNLLSEAGFNPPDTLAQQLCLLMEGAIVMALIHRNPVVAQEAKGAAKALLNNARKE